MNAETMATTGGRSTRTAESAGAQLDLFLDSRGVALVNDVIAALVARDAPSAVAAVARLRSHEPRSRALPALDALTSALAAWRLPAAGAQAIARAATWIDNDVAAAARQVMGSAAEAFIAGFFRELADAARGLAYSEAQPTAHRAWLCLRCGAWAEAEEAALSIGQTTPDALQWLAIASYRQRGLAAARPALFALAWHAPQRLASTLAELRDELLDRDWQRFSVASEWTSVTDGELPAWFPAWYLLEHPAASDELNFFDAPINPPAEAARLLKRLYSIERRGHWRELCVQRGKLRALNAEIFTLYMARRTVSHR